MTRVKRREPRGLPSEAQLSIGNDLREIKGMGVDHVILGLTEPEPDRVIDIAVIAFL